MEEKKNKKQNVIIGTLGHVNYGRTNLNDAIKKALQEYENAEPAKSKKKQSKRKYKAINDEVVEFDDISKLDL